MIEQLWTEESGGFPIWVKLAWIGIVTADPPPLPPRDLIEVPVATLRVPFHRPEASAPLHAWFVEGRSVATSRARTGWEPVVTLRQIGFQIDRATQELHISSRQLGKLGIDTYARLVGMVERMMELSP